MELSLVLFSIVAAFTLLAAVGVVATRNVVYAALFLLAALLGVAGLFVLLYAEFLALVQVFIYGGAIIIVILFALMLTRTSEFEVAADHRRAPFAAVAAAGLFGLLVYAFVADASQYNTDVRGGITFVELGRSLFEEWAVPFEIASLLLLVAMVGAVVLARIAGNVREEDEPLPEDELVQETPDPDQAGPEPRELAAAGRRSEGSHS